MWLKLGDDEMLNLDYVVSFKKGARHSIEIHLSSSPTPRIIPFGDDESRDDAFDIFADNLINSGEAME